jgi:hypothetical protein
MHEKNPYIDTLIENEYSDMYKEYEENEKSSYYGAVNCKNCGGTGYEHKGYGEKCECLCHPRLRKCPECGIHYERHPWPTVCKLGLIEPVMES